MYIRNSRINLIYRAIYLFVCGFGILRHLSLGDSVRNINMLSYFTIQSNIICFIVMLVSIIHSLISSKRQVPVEYARAHLFLKGLALLMITITGLTYNLVLTGHGFSMVTGKGAGFVLNDMIVHFIVPVMTWLDYIIFQPKGSFKKKDPLVWLLAPVIYFIFIMIKAVYVRPDTYGVGIKRYPYYFLDVQKYGVMYVVKYVLIFIVVTLVLGYLIRTIDFVLGMIYTRVQKFRIRKRMRKGNASDRRE